MTNYRVTINGQDLDISLIRRQGSNLSFTVGADQYTVNVEACLEDFPLNNPKNAVISREIVSNTKQTSAPSSAVSQAGTILAPMPGIIVSIAAKEGQIVAAQDVLLVMEAMKMENNITASRAGTIKRILVKAGQEVENHAPLIEID